MLRFWQTGHCLAVRLVEEIDVGHSGLITSLLHFQAKFWRHMQRRYGCAAPPPAGCGSASATPAWLPHSLRLTLGSITRCNRCTLMMHASRDAPSLLVWHQHGLAADAESLWLQRRSICGFPKGTVSQATSLHSIPYKRNMWTGMCRRDVTQAAAGATGIILLTSRDSVEAGALAAPLQAAVAATARAVPLPLLILVADGNTGSSNAVSGSSGALNGTPGSEATEEASGEALAQELHSGSSGSGVRVSAVKVVSIGARGQAGLSEAALLQGLAWLAEHAPPQPRLWVRPSLASDDAHAAPLIRDSSPKCLLDTASAACSACHVLHCQGGSLEHVDTWADTCCVSAAVLVFFVIACLPQCCWSL